MRNLYEILGINQNASEDEIKNAFKKLAVKWHPDKFSGKSDKEKKEAEEKFKEINLAKEVLTDPNKRAHYDRFGTIEGMDEGSGGFSGFDGMDVSDIINMMRGNMGGFNPFGGERNYGPEPGESIQYTINISIDELFNGCSKDIEYYILERCKKCNGKGGDKETCPYCHGTGMITEVTRQSNFSIFRQSHPCGHCGGRGFTLKNKCTECNGEGRKKVKKNIRVNIPVGIQEGTPIRYNNMGCDSLDERGKRGDFIGIIRYNFDSSKYRIIDNVVYERLDIPYYDCILGREIERELPNKKKYKFKIPEYSKESQQIRLRGKGINGNDYIFIIHVKMPDRVSPKEKDLLKSIQKIGK